MSEDIRPLVVDTPTNSNLEIHDFLVIDRSGSMASIWTETIQGINTYLAGLRKTQQDTGVKTFVSIMFFDNEQIIAYDNCPAIEVRDIDPATYAPRNGTALNDAIGSAIDALKTRLAGREGSQDVDATISIFTDGDENISTRYRGKGNKELFGYIDELKNQYGWTFTFTGAGTEEQVRAAAAHFGFDASNVQSYESNNAVACTASFSNMANSRSVKSALYCSTGLKSNAGYFSNNPSNTLDILNPLNPINIITTTTTGDTKDDTALPASTAPTSGTDTSWSSGGSDWGSSSSSSYDSGSSDSGGSSGSD